MDETVLILAIIVVAAVFIAFPEVKRADFATDTRRRTQTQARPAFRELLSIPGTDSPPASRPSLSVPVERTESSKGSGRQIKGDS
jgi:hypothetical protein